MCKMISFILCIFTTIIQKPIDQKIKIKNKKYFCVYSKKETEVLAQEMGAGVL